MMPTTLAERVRRRRQELGLTLKELAQLVGVSQGHLSRIENGRSVPSARTVTRLTKVCGFAAVPAAAIEVERSAARVGGAPAAVRGSWSFVGRQEELAAIASAAVAAGCGGIVLAGTQGVGKTRLAREALNAAADGGRATAWVSGVRE